MILKTQFRLASIDSGSPCWSGWHFHLLKRVFADDCDLGLLKLSFTEVVGMLEATNTSIVRLHRLRHGRLSDGRVGIHLRWCLQHLVDRSIRHRLISWLFGLLWNVGDLGAIFSGEVAFGDKVIHLGGEPFFVFLSKVSVWLTLLRGHLLPGLSEELGDLSGLQKRIVSPELFSMSLMEKHEATHGTLWSDDMTMKLELFFGELKTVLTILVNEEAFGLELSRLLGVSIDVLSSQVIEGSLLLFIQALPFLTNENTDLGDWH